MAEHGFDNFEHDFAEKLKKLDENIIVPEIPDAQNIFDRAESETKVFSFKKYKRIAGVAAAVVLICVSFPVLGGTIGKEFDIGTAAETAEAPRASYDALEDCVEEEAILEAAEEPAEAYDSMNSSVEIFAPTEGEKSMASVTEAKNIKKALEAFFEENEVELNPQIGSLEKFRSYSLAEEINKKRSMDISVEEDSVSVMLFDNSGEEEAICAFWMEGAYRESYLDGENYIVSTYVRFSGDMVKADDYLPMYGDAEKGTAFIDENKIILPEEIEKGAMIVTAKISISTGEYEISAEII